MDDMDTTSAPGDADNLPTPEPVAEPLPPKAAKTPKAATFRGIAAPKATAPKAHTPRMPSVRKHGAMRLPRRP